MSNENILGRYLNEINRIPLLSRDEEAELAVRAQAGDKRAKDEMARANLRFVVKVAKKYQNHGLDLCDLISEGNIGLLTAIDKFDVSKGYHFISYAVWWIRQAILKAICEKSRAIRLPLNRVNEIVKIEHARKIIGSAKNDEEELAEIGEMLEMKPSHVRELLDISREMISLDAPVVGDGNDGASFGDFVPDTLHDTPEEAAMTTLLRDDINEVLSTLRPNEARVIKMRYGLNGDKPMSLKEVGEQCHLTKERIRQIEKRAIVRMRHPRRLQKLEAYVA